MHSPSLAQEVWPSHRGHPGVCRTADGSRLGFFVPYQLVGVQESETPLAQWEAWINLYVIDRASPYTGFIPFLVDPGSHVTIIPKPLVEAYAFPIPKAIDPRHVEPVAGLGGGIVTGRIFSIHLAIVPQEVSYGVHMFQPLDVLVVDSLADNYAVLGLDAIRQVTMVSDDKHVAFWQREPTPM